MFIPIGDWLSSSISRQLDGSFVLERKLDGKRRAFAERRTQFDGATEQVREPLRKRQAEAGATVSARRGAVDLAELIEHVLLGVEPDPDAGVLYAIHDPVVGEPNTGNDLATLSELHRIAE